MSKEDHGTHHSVMNAEKFENWLFSELYNMDIPEESWGYKYLWEQGIAMRELGFSKARIAKALAEKLDNLPLNATA